MVIIGAQLQPFDVGLYINDQPRLVGKELTAGRQFARAQCHHALQVEAGTEFAVIGRGLGVRVAIELAAFELRVTPKTGAVAVDTGRGAHGTQRAVSDILLIRERNILVAPAIA